MTGVFGHPWLGGLFAGAEAAAIWSPERQLAHMLGFEAAYTRALGAAGKIPEAQAERVAAAILAFRPDFEELRAGTARDGLPVPALVAQLRHALPGDAAAIHSGATSQDVIDTAAALTMQEFSIFLQARIGQLSGALSELSRRFGAVPMMGRTRMQAALPITAADRLNAWSGPLDNHLRRLGELRPRVELLQLGGAAGDRAAMAPHAEAIAAGMARNLGLGNPPRAWHAARDGVAEYAGLLSLITGTLGKMGQDICLMAQQGVEEIALETGGGSSAMPHKQNPVLAELLVSLARFNATQIAGMHQALVHEQERSGAAWNLEWMILPQMAQATARSLSAAAGICASISRIGAKAPS
ncbi:3-carboxy-cis,cis-muconate cycloisomerase [Cribrihabitans neustonicus]|uniref:3-carboxy-cis,cis-muconate cycloisomerase n=1 Tax=Cribrihabitans neustonicus TaxID=1429085 RepID=UPI003B59FE41